MTPDGSLRTRVLILAAVIAAAFGGLTARLADLQIVRHAELGQMAERQYSRTVVLGAQRGPIVDRHGAPLASSTPGESLFVQPRHVGDPVRVAARLAPVLQMPEAEVHQALTSSRAFVWLRRKVAPAVAAEVRDLREPGLGFMPEPLRLYPNRELAAHVVGFEGTDGGLEGIERSFNDELAGTPGKAIVGRDALGREVVTQQVIQAPAPGHGVMLTLDTTIQYLAERELDAAYRRTGARAAMAVVMDPRSGGILAMAIRPTFNPNTFADVPSRDHWRNRAVTDPFEPGSTFKVILAAAALEEGTVRPDDRIYAEDGSITIAKTTIHDWKRYGWLTFAEVLQHSSNVGAIKVGLGLGRDRAYRYMTAFGFGAPTGVGLAGESRGVLREPGRWSALTLPTVSIGQEVSVTALQMVTAIGALANGGTLMQPRLVQATFDASGREIRRFEPRAVRQVVSAEAARTLTRLMVRVVQSGTGHNAAIPGYEVAGKTGTAQKLDPVTRRYSRAPGVLSFAGFVPADDPRLVIFVMLDEPKNEKWGSEAAAPIFAAIGRDVLRYLEVPPRDAQQVQIVTGGEGSLAGRVRLVSAGGEEGADERDPRMPDLSGKTLRQALAALVPLHPEVEISGRGVVVRQTPAAGAIVEPGATARLVLTAPSAPRVAPGRGRLPAEAGAGPR
ncbi:MAG: PASTA domain-containing protein [Candidatus Rokubacteria bacterium]|nr:PASTA domain-containing protein [Candidatus Rokubacteria bacterium]